MARHKVSIDDALRAVYKVFQGAEVVKRDGSRERLSDILGLAADVKSRRAISRQSNDIHQQLSLDFGDNIAGQPGVAHD